MGKIKIISFHFSYYLNMDCNFGFFGCIIIFHDYVREDVTLRYVLLNNTNIVEVEMYYCA